MCFVAVKPQYKCSINIALIYITANNKNNTNQTTPSYVLINSGGYLTNATSIFSNQGNACANLSDNKTFCWGYYYHIGNNATSTNYAQERFSRMRTSHNLVIENISFGERFTCLDLSDGGIICEGDERYGEFGNSGMGDSRYYYTSYPQYNVKNLSKEDFKTLDCEKAHTIISILSDEDNYIISEIAYEHLGTKNVIVRLNERENYDKFKELGVNIVEPSSAMVNLLDHFARSPGATSILLGMEEGQDTIDIEITAEEMHGMALRNIRFPSDVIILSVHRKKGALVCHGFTRLRLGDIVTVVGSVDSLEKVMVKLSE